MKYSHHSNSFLKPHLFIKCFSCANFFSDTWLNHTSMLLLMLLSVFHPSNPHYSSKPFILSETFPDSYSTYWFTLYLTLYWMVFIMYLTITRMRLFTILNLSFFTYKRITPLVLLNQFRQATTKWFGWK